MRFSLRQEKAIVRRPGVLRSLMGQPPEPQLQAPEGEASRRPLEEDLLGEMELRKEQPRPGPEGLGLGGQGPGKVVAVTVGEADEVRGLYIRVLLHPLPEGGREGGEGGRAPLGQGVHPDAHTAQGQGEACIGEKCDGAAGHDLTSSCGILIIIKIASPG